MDVCLSPWFRRPNKVNPLINELDLNRSNAITTLSKVLKYLKLYCKLKFLVDSSGWELLTYECTQTSDIAKTYSVVLIEMIVFNMLCVQIHQN